MTGAREVVENPTTIEQVQHEVLTLISTGASLAETLERLIVGIEAMNPEMIGSVLELDAEGLHVRHATGPHLPDAYLRAIDGSPIGPQAGSCGTAAYLRRRVVVEDIASDPLWEVYRAVALPFGLRACWSEPILSASGRVLGTFAMYYRAPRAPTPRDLELITVAGRLAAIAMERNLAEEALATSEEAYRTIYERVPVGIVSVDADGTFLRANPAFCRMTGYSEEELRRMRFADLTHPDDVAESLDLLRRMQAGEIESFEIEKRYVRRDGTGL